ncbi:Csu type fimbrial protein [Pseudoxanthomonas sacheonensis]|uniref:Spore coat protein U-like protein n=1 Tax=Pseudoxanthomonas sacheonensis TaxID=443615 RepID=A0ABU1RNL6_9GAMM|nr:spore coat protein U domain-containing protein [Pseudoxanthomonas sacheonensis]MDR6840207.1 spore coat protein U-like protein [Pseudoxanthomonas sacheonensis]
MSSLRIHRLLLLLLLAAGAGGLSTAAKAATTCTGTATSVAFGTVSTTGVTDVSATFNVTCSTSGLGVLANTKVRMCLNIGDGANGIGFFNPRRMTNGFGEPLNFQLYTDAARSQIWGSRGNPTVPTPQLSDFDYAVPLFGGNETKTFTIYGRIPVQTLIAGSYSNPFTGFHISLEYRYDEALLNANYPASCISGGDSGMTAFNAFPFTATATVPSNCRAYTTTDLDFGSIPGLITSNTDQTSTINMTCTGRTAWNVGLNNGQNASGSIRRMRLGATGNYVAYELYSNPGRTVRWGNTINTDTIPGTGTGVVQSLTVYGRVPATQTVPSGSYSDIITVTVTY